MSDYSDTILKAITRNCRVEIRKELRQEILNYKDELKKINQEAKLQRRENQRLKRELCKYKTEESKIDRKMKELRNAESELKHSIQELERLKNRTLGSFITRSWYSNSIRNRKAYNKIKKQIELAKKK